MLSFVFFLLHCLLARLLACAVVVSPVALNTGRRLRLLLLLLLLLYQGYSYYSGWKREK